MPENFNPELVLRNAIIDLFGNLANNQSIDNPTAEAFLSLCQCYGWDDILSAMKYDVVFGYYLHKQDIAKLKANTKIIR
jgi:hypothetical protein